MIGTQVGPFTIVCPLGQGRTSSVFLAEHAVLKTRRAIKRLAPRLTFDGQLVQRFVHEARAAARLRHRNLIQVHDIGQLVSGAWFMLLDYLDGHTLARLLAGHAGPMSPQLIVHIVAQIANGLQVAHRHQIVHRDLKPENVFLTVREGDSHHVVLLDFGVAELAGEPGGVSLPTVRGELPIGTPAYMPPEQLRGSAVGPSADIYALGVMAYQMSTGGWFPYQQDESSPDYRVLPAAELYQRQMARAPVDPRERWAGLDDAWAAALLGAVHPDPALRPASAAVFALRLALAVPAINGAPDGLAIVRACARELIDTGAGHETLRVPMALTAPPAPSAAPPAGSRYQLGDKLGAGGMAEVFAGTMIGALGFARPVAIKRVLPGLSQIPAFATMFVAEAQIASRLTHPNIVSVLDFSRDPEDRLVLVMELVDGTDLASVLEAGPISPSLAIFIAVEMLRGLGHAHELADPVTGGRGVIHRDVSPQNLLLSHEGAVKVSDFGLAKVRAASDGVRSDVVRGKPGYMAPEQCAGEPLDGRADLYAVGVMLWEMLAHRPLFVGTSKEILAQVMFREVAAPRRAQGSVPADVAAVAMKLLARDRDARYPTAEAVVDALLACCDAPRDGRGELVSLLAQRFPRGAGTRSVRAGSSAGGRAAVPTVTEPAAAAVPPGRRAAQIAVPSVSTASPASPASHSGELAAEASPAPGAPKPSRRGTFAATITGLVLVGAAAAVAIAHTDVAPPGTADRAVVLDVDRAFVRAPARGPVRTASRMPSPVLDRIAEPPAPRAAAAPVQPQPPVAATPPPPALPRRDRVIVPGRARTGELAIIVKPWAMIWLNGKPSGQTPFRAPVPVGRYRVRLANDDVGQNEVTMVTVEPDRTATIERTW
jgi:serine/threonine protein kinase